MGQLWDQIRKRRNKNIEPEKTMETTEEKCAREEGLPLRERERSDCYPLIPRYYKNRDMDEILTKMLNETATKEEQELFREVKEKSLAEDREFSVGSNGHYPKEYKGMSVLALLEKIDSEEPLTKEEECIFLEMNDLFVKKPREEYHKKMEEKWEEAEKEGHSIITVM